VSIDSSDGTDADGRYFYGLSYSPFGLADNLLCPPFDPTVGGQCLLPNQVKLDMEAIAKLTSRVKTYSTVCTDALEQIMQCAKEHGMTVMFGVWVTPNKTNNAVEIRRMEYYVKKYHGIISHLVVGNEPILIEKTPVSTLVDAINCVRARVNAVAPGANIPIGVADIYNTWMGMPLGKGYISDDAIQDVRPVAEASDWIGLNSHPYWSGVDPTTGKSGANVLEMVQTIKAKFKKPVLVTETGFPTQGKPQTAARGTASPSIDGLTLFLADIEAVSRKNKLPVYMFEPFDGDWKRRWHPFIESDYHFGLTTCDRKMKAIKLPPRGAI
jgi:exo-beta-1,3-glucanase (GH17 family)